MRFALSYDPRALEYLSTTSAYASVSDSSSLGFLGLALPGSQNVAKGEIARVKYLVTVPDSVVSTMVLSPGRFTSDSIMFIKPVPTGDTTTITVGARCSLSRLVFVQGLNLMTTPKPNPTSGRVTLDISLLEDSRATLRVLNSAGQNVFTLLDGSQQIQHGSYHVEFGQHPRLANL